MNVVFRVDASVEIGSGHLMRCLTLADALKPNGAKVLFVCRNAPGSMADLVTSRGYECATIDGPLLGHENDARETGAHVARRWPSGATWVVVDHYGLDEKWEKLMRPLARNVMVIDDLANRRHDCDLLLDQNYYVGQERRYAGLVPASTRCLLGPAHVLLRPEFVSARRALRRRAEDVRSIFVFFGSTDPTNQTQQALRGIDSLCLSDVCVDVVVGNANPHREDIRAFCKLRPWARFHCQISNMAELIAGADIGIGAGGAAMWERCALGLPTLTVVFADNQFQTTSDVATTGAIAYLGWAGDLSAEDYASAIRQYLDHPDDLAPISAAALQLIDASVDGAALVIRAMAEFSDMKVSG